ncbi:hypothetical protein CORC01_03725 [Colletotrichum orchidophilum]|uniref:Nudix hydrolase domain-containing protein n=1 Tax=Colletotrichum orchidophilum TaxID=1209926 RepID=A0A1G4BHZ1_9PEZI|nr:uncharacterized protein CORC01_03725 [Colletotrichum orchidophilum]OHF00897.1 hypothetical protein CORC01_03725 [Colletotrichum orchidophilum]
MSGITKENVYEILLLKRSASDSFPLRWEIPGGTADLGIDQDLVQVAIRELWEETRLRALKVFCAVGLGLPSHVSNLSTLVEGEDVTMDQTMNFCLLAIDGLTWAVSAFIIDVEDSQAQIVLREDEHLQWAWVTEEEVKQKMFNSESLGQLDFVTEAMKYMILEGFRLRRKI